MRESWLDNAVWGILLLLLVPSGLIVASWNSLPGSMLYKVKLASEDVLVTLAPTGNAKGELEVAYTGRRLSEATQLLTEQSSAEGLEYFRKQAEEAKQAIANAPPGQARSELAMKYIVSLQQASSQLEQQKQMISASQPRSQQSNRQQQVTVVNQTTQVVQQINQTQTVINTIINNVQQIQQTQTIYVTVTPSPTQYVAPTATPYPTVTSAPTLTPIPTTQSGEQTCNPGSDTACIGVQPGTCLTMGCKCIADSGNRCECRQTMDCNSDLE